jgi:hypothetical protein
MVAQLKVYHNDDEVQTLPEPSVHVRLGDLLPLLQMAQQRNFRWLKDFLEDEVAITDDLYDVLQHFRTLRPSA